MCSRDERLFCSDYPIRITPLTIRGNTLYIGDSLLAEPKEVRRPVGEPGVTSLAPLLCSLVVGVLGVLGVLGVVGVVGEPGAVVDISKPNSEFSDIEVWREKDGVYILRAIAPVA